ncbi:MAG: hypothetical protein ACK4NP_14590 [Parvularculaceae bacterium]
MITDFDPKSLCLGLLKADTEAEVVLILSRAKLWQDRTKWRYLGDQEHNFSTVGGQQRQSEQALIEKLVNSIDTKLIAEARVQGYLGRTGSDPLKTDMPTTIAEAREKFFGDRLRDAAALSTSITVAATGAKPNEGRPSFTIVDNGEGQTPAAMCDTILSLHKGNKDKIKFVQGKFNMGGTGVLEFCGRDHNVQLIISRRHPKLRSGEHPLDDDWSFTVIRREDPVEGRSSRYTYLAPLVDDAVVGDSERAKMLLHFKEPTLPLFPDKNIAYKRETEWGTLIKLYEYEAKRFGTNMMMTDGLMYRVRLLLTSPALPIRFHECRSYRGDPERSFDTTMTGLLHTLGDDLEKSRGNVEKHFREAFTIEGLSFDVDIFLFRDKQAADSYKKDEGIIFTLNGQAHALFTKDFFKRKNVKQDYISHALLVVVNCDQIGQRGQEKLFMNSRDGLRDGDLKRKLTDALEELLRSHQELKQLASERRKKELAEQTTDHAAMAKVIENLLLKNPSLAALLGKGFRVKNPHKPEAAGGRVAGFIGRRFPTKFHFKDKESGVTLERPAHRETNVRITFETDAANDYFKRDEEPGEFQLFRILGEKRAPATDFHRPRLHDGYAHLTLSLPNDAQDGEKVEFEVVVSDPSQIDPFTNKFILDVKPERETESGSSGERRRRADSPGDKKSSGGEGSNQFEDSNLDIPLPREITESMWDKQDPPFDRFTALRVMRKPDAPEGTDSWDYLVNIDNVHLQNEMKSRPKHAETLKLRFSVALTLVALSMLHQNNTARKGEDSEDSGKDGISDRVEQVTQALAPFILPIIESVGALERPEEALSDSAGEAA